MTDNRLDGDYELKMDELLCRLTNGKWSKSRSYSVDFMVGCVDEAYEDAALGVGECEMDVLDTGNEAAYEHYEYIMRCKSCHHEFGYVQYNEDGDTWQDEKPAYCPNCGKAVKR